MLPIPRLGTTKIRTLDMINSIKSKIDHWCVQLRDELNKRYPVTHMFLAARQEEKWLDVYKDALTAENIFDVDKILSRASLGYTSSFTGVHTDIDLSAATFPFIFDAVNKICVSTEKKIFVYSEQGDWLDATKFRFKAWVQKPSKSGCVELAVVDSSERLVSRLSINLWVQKSNFIENPSESAPVKRLSSQTSLKVDSSARTDWYADPIDVVYTWVNSSDKGWQEKISEFKDLSEVDADRFDQCDELKYSIRSIEMYAPWVRNIFIFSNCAPPDWFEPSDRVRWVMHEEVVPEVLLPLFNSHAIETFLHLVPGVSEKFLYFNDDFFLTGFVRPSDFFTAYGQSVSRLEPYGALPYFQQLRDEGRAEEWHCAALNCADLLFSHQGVKPTKAHRHAPYALQKSLYEDLINTFQKEAAVTRNARFRQLSDFSFTSFLYHHYALNRGRAVESNENSMIIRPNNFRRFSAKKIYKNLRFFCLNDGGGSASDNNYNKFKSEFLKSFYPFKSQAEK